MPPPTNAILTLGDSWRFRRYPILGAHCLSVARAKQGEALPPQFSSVHFVRIAAHRGHPLRCLCFPMLLLALPLLSRAVRSRCRATHCLRRSRLSFADANLYEALLCFALALRGSAERSPSLALHRIALATPNKSLLSPCRASLCESQHCLSIPLRLRAFQRLSRVLPG